jgi:hypothetical protein
LDDIVEDEEIKKEDSSEEENVEKKETEETKGKTEEPAKPTKKELEGIVNLIKEDATLKSKGLEVNVKDFNEEQLNALLQKGLRFYQAMEEVAKERETVSEKAKTLEAVLEKLESQSVGLSTSAKAPGKDELSKDLFEVSELDEPETVALKKALKQMNDKLESLSSTQTETQAKKEQEALVNEIKNLQEIYPLSTVEEVLSVYFLTGGKVPVREIMKTSHEYYGSNDFIKRIFEAKPELRKQFEEETVKGYLTKQTAAKKSAPKVKVAGATTKPVVSTPEKEAITKENVSQKARDYLKELARLTREEEE